MRKSLPDTDLVAIENETNVNKSWAKFYNILNRTIKLCFPVCKRRPRKNNKSKWWNSQNEAGLLHKKYAHEKYLLTQNKNYMIECESLGPKNKDNKTK